LENTINLLSEITLDYLNVRDHNPPTSQTNGRMGGRLTMAVLRSV